MEWWIEYYISCLLGTSLIAVFILGIRFLFSKKMSKRFVYGLWFLIPAVMLLVPVISIPMPRFFQTFQDNTIEQLEGEIRTIVISAEERMQQEKSIKISEHANGIVVKTDDVSDVVKKEAEVFGKTSALTEEKKDREINRLVILLVFYIVPVLAFVAGIVSTNIRFEHNCRHNRIYLCETPYSKLPVYRLKNISSPFLLCATVYVPEGMTEEELRYAMLHEEGHFKHGDFIWVIIRYMILAVFFYNPIIWFAFKYSGYDCELACDETVMLKIGIAERKRYGSCLLDVIRKHKKVSERVLLSTNMKSEKKLIRARIENIVSGKKSSILLMIVTACILIMVSGCALMERRLPTEKGVDGEFLEIAIEEQVSEAERVNISERSDASEEHTTDSSQKTVAQESPAGAVNDNIVDYGDTVYCCAEVLRKIPDTEGNFEVIESEHEISFRLEKDMVIIKQTSDFASEVISYVAKEIVGKSVSESIQVIREYSDEEYYYYFLITSINDTGEPSFSLPQEWEYQLPQASVGEFFDTQEDEIDYGFNEKEIETGCFFVPGEYKNYSSVIASSELEETANIYYSPDNLAMQSKWSVWSEGVSGYGIGETIDYKRMYMGPGPEQLTFDKLCIVNGYAENEKKWQANSRVKSLKFYYFDEYMGTITLEDTMYPQYIDLSELNMTIGNGREASFRFEIAEVYEGEKYEDTCMTGIMFSYVWDDM